jgi:hypothetical protein
MKHDTYHIVWQKWADPLGEDDMDNISPEDNVVTSDNIDPEFYDDTGEPISNNTEISDNVNFYQKPTRVIMTPMGIIPYTDNTASNKIFNLWVGHTNFDITTPIVKMIESYPGIETLDIFTRYRFRIGVGKLFNAGEVMSTLTDDLYKYLLEHEN